MHIHVYIFAKVAFNYTVQSVQALYIVHILKTSWQSWSNSWTLTCHFLSRLVKTWQDMSRPTDSWSHRVLRFGGADVIGTSSCRRLTGLHGVSSHDILFSFNTLTSKKRLKINITLEWILCDISSHSQVETCLLLTSAHVFYWLLLCTAHKCVYTIFSKNMWIYFLVSAITW